MNRRQKIIVSITGIFLVLMILVGLTYAYFLTKITGNTNTKSISVTTANLVLEYGENTNVVQGINNAEPGYSVEKIFTATNKGNSTVTYGAALEDIVNGLSRQEDLVYTLTCTSYLKDGFKLASDGTITGTVDGDCSGVTSETKFPSTSTLSIMTTNTIDTTHTHAYKLTVTYKEMGVDQSVDMNKTFSAKVNIVDLNAMTVNNPYKNDTGTLKKAIIDNAMLGLNGTTYSETPLTSPGNAISTYKYVTTNESGIEQSANTMSVSSTYQGYYWVYGTGYTVDETSGKFTLTGVNSLSSSSQTYANMYNDLVGKYLISSSVSDNSVSSTTTANPKTTSNISRIYKVTAATSSQITYKRILPQTVGTEKTLSKTEDDYGDTYYFRGKVEDNYVNFAGMCWRIVRIAGDGSVKLILEDKNTTCDSSSYTGNWNIGSGNFGNDAYANYLTVMNYLNPTADASNAMVNKFKTFQTSKLSSYLDKLKAGDWCLDDNAYANSASTSGTPLTEDEKKTYYTNETDFYYDSYVRLNGQSTKTPTNKCNGTVLNKYSDNTDMYVATLTANEIVYAGGKVDSNNYGYYLLNDYQRENPDYWWVLSPSEFGGVGGAYSFDVHNDGQLGRDILIQSNALRVAVSLKSNIQISSGNGTKENPYEIAS